MYILCSSTAMNRISSFNSLVDLDNSLVIKNSAGRSVRTSNQNTKLL